MKIHPTTIALLILIQSANALYLHIIETPISKSNYDSLTHPFEALEIKELTTDTYEVVVSVNHYVDSESGDFIGISTSHDASKCATKDLNIEEFETPNATAISIIIPKEAAKSLVIHASYSCSDCGGANFQLMIGSFIQSIKGKSLSPKEIPKLKIEPLPINIPPMSGELSPVLE
jgi:hypothetical protein